MRNANSTLFWGAADIRKHPPRISFQQIASSPGAMAILTRQIVCSDRTQSPEVISQFIERNWLQPRDRLPIHT